jgi:PAS domain S-box-containing protein
MTHPSDVKQRWQAVPDAMGSVGFVIDSDGVYREVIYDDDTEYQLYDDPETLRGKQLQDVLPEPTAKRFREHITQALATGNSQRIEYDLTVKGGHHWFIAHIAPIPAASDDEDPETVLWLTDDITERKEAEQALEQTRDHLRQVIDLIPDPIYVKNRQDEILLTNEANADLLGTTPEEIENEPEPAVMPEVTNYETLRQRDIDVIDSGEPTVFEEQLRSPDIDDHTFKTTRIPFEPVTSDADAVLGYARDVTDLKTYEHQLESQRDNLEILNGVVRHDIRNKLQLIQAYTRQVQSAVDGTAEEDIERVLDAVRNAVDITTTAREVTEVMLQSEPDDETTLVAPVLESQMEAVQANHEEAVVCLDGSLPSGAVRADEMLASVFRNVLSNAITHNDKEVPAVTVAATSTGEQIVVRIRDNGPGIPDEHKAAVFNQGEMGLGSNGTGLGLYLVETLVDRYGGDVRIEDNDPEGSVVVIELVAAIDE